MKRLEKQLSRKENFGRFLQLNCSNFKLKQRERPYSYQNCQKNNNFEGVWGELESKHVSRDNQSQNI